MNDNPLLETVDPTTLNELQFLLTDLLSGDEQVLARPEYKTLNTQTLQAALDFLLNNPLLDEKQKAYLLSNSWRVNYRDKPPSVQEFLTEKYIGRAALHTYDRIKKIFIEFMDPSKPYRHLVLYPHIGFGKATDINAKVLTPAGYTLMKDVQAGDEVCTPGGGVARVVSTHDQPVSQLFKVTFSDGRTVVTHEDHLWKAATSRDRKEILPDLTTRAAPSWKTITTGELYSKLCASKKASWFVPLTEPAFHSEKKHLISPYVLGALLGDGHLGKHQISLCGNDKSIFERVERELPSDMKAVYAKKAGTTTYSCTLNPVAGYTRSSFMKELERLGLAETRSGTKFIPSEYLYDSVQNRIALLQGLLDTDGSASLGGYANFTSKSQELIEGLQTLVRGLGGYTGNTGRERHRERDETIILHVGFPERTFPLFHLARKQERVDQRQPGKVKTRRYPILYISSIEKDRVDVSRCITLDSEDHLYLTEDYIVTHNSYLATLINIYIGTHLSMMRSPYKYFGLNPASVLTQLLVSYSLKKSSELLLEPLLAILEASPFFERIKTRETMIRRDAEYERQTTIDRIYWTTAVPTSAIQMSNGANFKMVSSVHNLLGLSVVSGTMSELGFFRDSGKSDEYIMRIFNDLKSRIDSRMVGNYFGRSILDSSPNTLDSPIDDYVVHDARKDPTNLIVEGSVWKWAPEDYDMDDTFKVFVGGKGDPPRIIDEDEDISHISLDKIIDVPKQLLQFFKDDLYKALKDRAGIPAGSADALIYDYAKIESVFDERLKNIYTHISASIDRDPKHLIWDQVKPLFFKSKAGVVEFYYKPHLPRVFAVDQSIAHDMSSIAVAHVEKIEGRDEHMYVIDFVVPIAPQGSRINLDAIRLFIQDLREEGNMRITHGSFDQFQSEAAIQYLKNQLGFQVERLSVDATVDPYTHLLSLIETGRLVTGRNVYFRNNLKSLRIVKHKISGKPKIDHDASRPVTTTGTEVWEKSMHGYYSKDVSDSVAAACELLRRYHSVAYDIWSIDALERLHDTTAEKKAAKEKVAAFMSKMSLS